MEIGGGLVGAIICILLLMVALALLIFGAKVNSAAVDAVFDALEERDGYSTVGRSVVKVVMLLVVLFSCGLLLPIEMLIVVIRANKKAE